ncbi:hypothetical protein DFA_08002 [Cavenderia fasciculata]|uniref:Uncharacterized protein n=1 Tax=Cavenderia fasciculata TaxID=261658 RepID=F4Q4L2_CACFS|nr:uncharacterized protein DFA_08002 [Cavenderia fasciculata]EGG17021.1 hypothetical protein DFA_08002 [Cavenderia fasciculata]|eukprot:XP_004355505.1 hypothetical protein DFA_08002 [Cavenderia fasciculata]
MSMISNDGHPNIRWKEYSSVYRGSDFIKCGIVVAPAKKLYLAAQPHDRHEVLLFVGLGHPHHQPLVTTIVWVYFEGNKAAFEHDDQSDVGVLKNKFGLFFSQPRDSFDIYLNDEKVPLDLSNSICRKILNSQLD